jgi:spermidine/putrescine transport system substrate-binding protein
MYATPNKAAYQLLPEEIRTNANIYPSDEYLERSYLIKHVGDDILKMDEIWQEIRNM